MYKDTFHGYIYNYIYILYMYIISLVPTKSCWCYGVSFFSQSYHSLNSSTISASDFRPSLRTCLPDGLQSDPSLQRLPESILSSLASWCSNHMFDMFRATRDGVFAGCCEWMLFEICLLVVVRSSGGPGQFGPACQPQPHSRFRLWMVPGFSTESFKTL